MVVARIAIIRIRFMVCLLLSDTITGISLTLFSFAMAGKAFLYFARQFIIPPPLRSPESMNKTAAESVGIHRPQRQSLFSAHLLRGKTPAKALTSRKLFFLCEVSTAS